MSRLFIVLMIFMSCTKNSDDTIACFTITERQCASDPYQSYSKPADPDKKNAILEYLQVNGIKNVKIAINPPYTGAVCLACSCPSGISYSLQLAVSDTTKLKTIGLLVTGVSCN